LTFQGIKDVLSVASPIAIIIGIIIAVVQLQSQARLRQFDTVMRVFATFGEDAFQHHFQRVANWKFKSYKEFVAKSTKQDLVSWWVVGVLFEMMGLLYKRNLAPLDLLDDILSGPLTRAWERSEPIVLGMRMDLHEPQLAEWFEFLYKAMQKRLAKPARARHT
jgi:hypothetical protein